MNPNAKVAIVGYKVRMRVLEQFLMSVDQEEFGGNIGITPNCDRVLAMRRYDTWARHVDRKLLPGDDRLSPPLRIRKSFPGINGLRTWPCILTLRNVRARNHIMVLMQFLCQHITKTVVFYSAHALLS